MNTHKRSTSVQLSNKVYPLILVIALICLGPIQEAKCEPIANAETKIYAVKIQSLKAYQVTDGDGNDEIALTFYNSMKSWALHQRMHPGQTWTIEKEVVMFNGSASIHVNEQDNHNPDDFIGSFTVRADQVANGTQQIPLVNKGGAYVLSYTVYEKADPEFRMVVMSDAQYGFCLSGHCKTHFDGSSDEANKKHVESIKKIRDDAPYFAGVIVNGDLTNTADRSQLNKYKNDYDKNFRMYPGLGNHDYKDYYDKWCTVGSIQIMRKYGCTKRILDYISSHVKKLPHTNFDYKKESGAIHTGSYSYSWDIGGYHFVQLHLHPAHELSFDVNTVLGLFPFYILQEYYRITSSMDWLRDDLANVDPGKKVVINMHAIGQEGNFLVDGLEAANGMTEFKSILDQHTNVIAVFGGHIHNWVTNKTIDDTYWSDTSKAGSARNWVIDVGSREVPVFYGGGAEMSKYMEVSFKKDRMVLYAINSTRGNARRASAYQVVTF